MQRPWLLPDLAPRQHHPSFPPRQASHHLLFRLVLSVPNGNLSTTKDLGIIRSIRRERFLNFREFSISLWCISSAKNRAHVVDPRGKNSSMGTIPLTSDLEKSRPCTIERERGLNYPRRSSLLLVMLCLFGPHRALLRSTSRVEEQRCGPLEGRSVYEDGEGGWVMQVL